MAETTFATRQLPNGSLQYQVLTTSSGTFPPVYSGYLLDGTSGGKTVFAVTSGKTLTLTATDNYNLTVPASGPAAMLNQANSFTLINPLTTIAESWIGPSSTTGIYFKGGSIGIGITAPTARLHFAAGTATASTAPIKFTAGVLLSALELGTLEFVDDGTNGHLYITRNIASVLTRTLIV